MSFKKALKVEKELVRARENGLFQKENWRDSKEYEALFKLVWNSGKEFLTRCQAGKLPTRKDFDLFYQEGCYSDMPFLYRNAITHTTGRHIKTCVFKELGTSYPLCREDIDTFISQFYAIRFWLPRRNEEIRIMECDPRTPHFANSLKKFGFSFCRIYKRSMGKLWSHVQIHKPHVLVFYGEKSLLGTVIPSPVDIAVLAEIDFNQIPRPLFSKGDVIPVTGSLHVWIRTELTQAESSCDVDEIKASLTNFLTAAHTEPRHITNFVTHMKGSIENLNEQGISGDQIIIDTLQQLRYVNLDILKQLRNSPLLSPEMYSIFDATYKRLVE
jgi:hypothetical protein